MKKLMLTLTFVLGLCFATSLVFVCQVAAKADMKTAFLVWTFDEGSGTTVKDKSNNGNNGTFVKDVKWVDGKAGKGVKLDGKTTGIMSSTAKGVGKTAFTEVLWVNFDDLAPENQFGYISCTGTSNARYFYFSTWSSAGAPHDALHCGTLDTKGAWGRGIATGRVLKKGAWTHVAGVIDTKAGFIRVYVNGAMTQELKIDVGDVPGTPKEIWVGASSENYQWLAGSIDDVAFFNVALAEADIKDIVTNGLPLAGTTAVDSSGKLPITWAQVKGE